MSDLLMTLLFLLLSWADPTGSDFYRAFNYNGHSYYLSRVVRESAKINCICESAGHYWVDVGDENENEVLRQAMTSEVKLGFFKTASGEFRSYHSHNKLSFLNLEVSAGNDTQLVLLTTGKWALGDPRDRGHYICENDAISPKYQNVTVRPIRVVGYWGHSYYIYNIHMNFEGARELCQQAHRGYPYAPNDAFEACALWKSLKGDTFLGVSPVAAKQEYRPWKDASAQRENCVVFDFKSAQFITQKCSNTNFVVCEADRPEPLATWVDCQVGDQPYFPTKTLVFSNRGYSVYDFSMSKTEAQRICAQKQGKLFMPTDRQENCAIMENVDSDVVLDAPAKATHVDYSGYVNWEPGHPARNASCVYDHFATNRWESRACRDSGFVCVSSNLHGTHVDCSNALGDEADVVDRSYTLNQSHYLLYNNSHTYYDSKRFCAARGQALVGLKVAGKVHEDNKIALFTDYRIFWKADSWNWIDQGPPVSPTWLHGEPRFKGERISCTSISPGGIWASESCGNSHMVVCDDLNWGKRKSHPFEYLGAILGGILGLLLLFLLVLLIAKRRNRARMVAGINSKNEVAPKAEKPKKVVKRPPPVKKNFVKRESMIRTDDVSPKVGSIRGKNDPMFPLNRNDSAKITNPPWVGSY